MELGLWLVKRDSGEGRDAGMGMQIRWMGLCFSWSPCVSCSGRSEGFDMRRWLQAGLGVVNSDLSLHLSPWLHAYRLNYNVAADFGAILSAFLLHLDSLAKRR